MKVEYRLIRAVTDPNDPEQDNYCLHQCVVDDNDNVIGKVINEPFLRGKTRDDIVTVLADAIRALDKPVVDEAEFNNTTPVFLHVPAVAEADAETATEND